MITLHESDITSFPHDNGIGVLRDVIRAYAEEELNGLFEFYMEYDSEGHLVDELKEERIIKAKAQDKLGYQLFRIYSITKNHENDNLIVRAQHITYDLADNFVESLVANNLTKKQVMELIGSSTVLPHPFNITSPNTTTRSSTKLYRTNPLQMVGGMEGSVLQIWGGQIERDNFNLILHDRRGSDDGVKVTYEKNITGLEATFDISNLVTRIFPFVFIEGSDNEPDRIITVNGKYIDSPHINDYEKIYIKPIDYSNDERIDIQDKTDAQIRQQLTNIASQYFTETGNDKIKVDMEVQFEHLWETEEYKHLAVLELVGMGDTVTIEHSRLKVNATAIVNYIRYDCIAEKNEEVRLGSVKARLTDNVNKTLDVVDKVEQAQQTANQAIRAANGKNTIYSGPDEPTTGMQKGDVWFKVVDNEWEATYIFDGIEWQMKVNKDSAEAKAEAQQAKDEAQRAVDRANQATQQATDAINQAQSAFDEAQNALGTASNAYDIATTLQGDVTNLSTLVDEHTGQISSITQSVSSLTTRIGDAEGNITALQQTSSSLAARLTSAEGNITTLTATVQGLQTRVSDAEGNISSVTQLANALQVRMTDAEGNISTLTQTASSLQSTVSSLQDEFDNLEIGGRNLLLNSTFNHDFENWRVSSGIIAQAEILPPESDKPNSNILKVTPSTRNAYPMINSVRVPIVSGDTFKLSFDIKVDDIPSSDGSILTIRTFASKDESGNGGASGFYIIGLSDHNFRFSNIGHDAVGKWNRIELTIIATTPETRWLTVAPYFFDVGYNYEIRELKLEKGNKATDWSPAPEDMATQSQITQLSDAINLRVQKGDIINQINISDETILIDGKRIHITGQTTIDDASIDGAKIKNASIGNAQIGTIDAAKIATGTLQSIDIFGVTIRGSTIWVDGDRPDFLYTNAIDTNPNTAGTHIYIRPTATGEVRATVTNTIDHYVPMRADSFKAAPLQDAYITTDEMLRVTSHDKSTYRNIRGNIIYGAGFTTTTTNAYIGTDNVLHVVNKGYVQGSAGDPIYRDIRANDIYNRAIITSETNAYIGADNELRVVNKGLSGVYRNVRANGYFGQFLTADPGLYAYVGTDLELRVTSRGLTTGVYRAVRALDYLPPSSTRETKKQIERYEENVLDTFRNTSVYSFLYKQEEYTNKKRLGVMLDEVPDIIHASTGDTIEMYSTVGYLWKGLKDHINETDKIRDEIEWLKIENQYLKQKIEQLEEMIA